MTWLQGRRLFDQPIGDVEANLLCELPAPIIYLTIGQDGKIIAETTKGLYEILPNGSFVGVTFE